MAEEDSDKILYKIPTDINSLKVGSFEHVGQKIRETGILRTRLLAEGFHIEYSGAKYSEIYETTIISADIGKLLEGIIKEGEPITPELRELAKAKLEVIISKCKG